MRFIPLLIVILVVATGGPARAADPCTWADALLAEDYVEEAKGIYAKLMAGEAPPECAREGLGAVRRRELSRIEERCSAGVRLLDAKQLERAKAVFESLAADKTAAAPDCAVQGLISVAKAKKEAVRTLAVERARELSRVGLRTEAVEELKSLLKSDEEAEVPADLEHLFGGTLPRWRALRRGLAGWAIPVLEIAVVAILALVVVALIGRRARKPALAIEEFKSDGLAQEDIHLGKDFSSMVRSQLNRLATGSTSGRIHQVTGPIQDVKLPAEVEAVIPTSPTSWLSPASWAKAIPALVNWLAPPAVLTLSGRLHRVGTRGVGVTAQLAEGERVLASYSFWRKTFDDASQPAQENGVDAYCHLAQFAAVWLLFELHDKLESGIELLGTDNWRSYAYFQSGLLAEESARESAARRLYVKALRLDPKLRGARVNLGDLLIRTGDLGASIEQLEQAKRESLEAAGGDRDPTLYSALYNLAAVKYEVKGIDKAKEEIDELLAKIDRTLETVGDQEPALGRHLGAIRPVAQAMSAGLKAELGEPKARNLIEGLAKDASSVYPRFHYNLACAYSTLAKCQPPAGGSPDPDLAGSLASLERCLRLFPAAASQARHDRSLEYVRGQKAREFEELLGKYQPSVGAPAAPPPSALAEVGLIGAQHAKSLAAEKIESREALLLAAIDPASRTTLAARVNVTEQLVTRWAHAMDLLRVVGLEPGHLDLLTTAGVRQLTELSACVPAKLKALLGDLARAAGGVPAPDLATVSGWVSDAQTNTMPKVVV